MRATVPEKVCPGYAATVNDIDAPVVTPAVYASGTGTTSRSRLLSTSRTIGVAAPGPLVGPDERARMHVALGHDAVERRRHPQVAFHVA